jgi:hypothetical protein
MLHISHSIQDIREDGVRTRRKKCKEMEIQLNGDNYLCTLQFADHQVLLAEDK